MPAFSLSYASFSLPLPTPRFWSAWTRLPVHLTTHQPGFSVPAQLLLSLFLKNVSLSPSLKEPSRYLLDETFQWNATSPCLALKKKKHKKWILVFKLCRAGGTGCFWKSSAFLVTASTGSQRVFFFIPLLCYGRWLWRRSSEPRRTLPVGYTSEICSCQDTMFAVSVCKPLIHSLLFFQYMSYVTNRIDISTKCVISHLHHMFSNRLSYQEAEGMLGEELRARAQCKVWNRSIFFWRSRDICSKIWSFPNPTPSVFCA